MTSGFWQAHGERAIYDSPWVWLGQVEHLVSFQPMPGTVDAEHHVYGGGDPVRIGDPTDPAEAARVEWVPLASVPGLLAAGEIWSAASVAALPLLLLMKR